MTSIMPSLALNDYQTRSLQTAIYPNKGQFNGLVYTVLKLNGEAGEVAEDVGKAIRDDGGIITANRKHKLIYELGDVLWYVSAVAEELGYSLEAIARLNLIKTHGRAKRGTISGSGSDR